MKIQYCSDLHLEFRENKKYLSANPLKPVGDILILAGDVVPFVVMDKHRDFFNYLSDHFEQTYWIPGNHEYYHADLAERSGAVYEKVKNNVLLVNNYTAEYKNTRLIFSTLWSNLSIQNQLRIQQGMSDFEVISYNGRRLIPEDYNEQHTMCLNYIIKQLEVSHDNTIVVTHHVPTFLNYPEKYKGDVLNEAFAVELYDLIEPSDINYWIYGHHHQNVSPFKIGNTNLITNQLGYVDFKEHQAFDNKKYIEVGCT